MTNRELRERAEALAAELGLPVTTGGLNHAALTELVGRLEAERNARPQATTGAPERAAHDAVQPAAPVRGAVRRRAPEPPAEDEPETLAPPPPDPLPAAPEPEPGRAGRYVVASGKVVVCARGHVRAGKKISPRDLTSDNARDARHAERVFADLVNRGIVVKA